MSSMDNLIASYYQPQAEPSELEKQAQIELFAKLAAHNGIDLEKLSEEQVATLWEGTFSKVAEEEDKGDGKKKEDAEKEHEEKKAAAAKLAEAEYLGRYMAHAMADEMKKIAGKGEGIGSALKNLGEKYVSTVKGEGVDKAKSLADKARKHLGKVEGKSGLSNVQAAAGRKAVADRAGRSVHVERAKQVGAIAAPIAAVGTAGAATYHAGKRDKKASALDELAGEAAVVKAAAAGYDLDEAADRVASILTLGVNESEKIAFVQDLDSAIDVRASELLEAAGYPVDWE